MKRLWILSACLPVLAALALVAFAQDAEEDLAFSDTALAESAIAQAETLLADGRSSEALARYLAALQLDPDSEAARAGIERAVLTRPAFAGDDRAREGSRLIETRLRPIEQALERLTERVTRINRDLDDDGAAEPITRRLEVELKDVQRALDRLDRDMDQMRRDLSRIERDVDRLKRRAR